VSGNDPFVDFVADIANEPNPPSVISISWGSTEQVNFFVFFLFNISINLLFTNT
jgi:hypothetical protein